ncbi:MAG: hypothetical protein VCD00_20435 [Candidatus Hydrogenedentota bacterium]
MPWIDIEEELHALDAQFEIVLSSFGPNVSRCSTAIIGYLGIRPGLEPKWILRFSPLTTLYPLFQAEGLEGVSNELARRATLGHLCLMVHSFIEDRYLDRQFDPTREELLFFKNMLLKGLSIIRESASFNAEFESTVEALMRQYASSQIEPPGLPGVTLTDTQVLENSSGRGPRSGLWLSLSSLLPATAARQPNKLSGRPSIASSRACNGRTTSKIGFPICEPGTKICSWRH